MNRYKYGLFLFTFLFIAGIGNTQTVIKHKDIKPFVPSIMGMGGGFTPHARGLASLWTNPAGLVNSYTQHDGNDWEITAFALSIFTQPYFTDVGDIYAKVEKIFKRELDQDGISSTITELTSQGFRSGISLYGGFVSPFSPFIGAFGLAYSNTIDISFRSPGGIFSSSGTIISQSELMFGYAYHFSLEAVSINMGISIRPFIRTQNTPITGNILMQTLQGDDFFDMVKSEKGLYGWGIGADVGVQIEWQHVFFGVDLRDIYTPLFYYSSSYNDITELFKQTTLTGNDLYVIPFQLDVGAGYQFIPSGKLGDYFQSLIYVQLTDPFDNTNTSTSRQQSFLNHIHMGIEFIILPPFFSVQVGFNQGYPTFGIGADLWLFDIQYVIFVQEEGYQTKEHPSPGTGIEIAFRW